MRGVVRACRRGDSPLFTSSFLPAITATTQNESLAFVFQLLKRFAVSQLIPPAVIFSPFQMADVTVDPQNKNPNELVTQGIRAFHIQNYPTAVQALSLASELLAAEHGDKHDSLGDVYLYYGKALLELSREEAEPLGDAVTKKLEDDSDSEEAEVPEEEKEEDKPEEAKTVNGEESKQNGEPGPSSGEKKPEDESTEETEEEPSDLQVAWEVLELAKIIYENQGESGRDKLAETLVVLGEVSLESENFESAVSDIKRGLEIMLGLPGKSERILAETHYKLGIALSTNSQMEEAIEQFKSSLELLQGRIKALEEEDKEKHATEITQMKELIPEIEEKISDMKNFRDEVGCIWRERCVF